MLFWPAMAESQRGRLFLVGTPIGNLEDLSPRARRTLAEADVLLCEDTRVTGKLAARFGLKAPRISCPAPREKSRVSELLRRLEAGQTVVLVSDAGMPGLSDPGEHLVAAAASAGFPVFAVPGPSAPAAALAVSGLPAVPHVFLGFLPARAGERRRLLQGLRDRPETLVWFEAPHRLSDSLEDAAQVLGPRRCAVARELTKLHEETVRGTLEDVARVFRSRTIVRGEATVVTEGRGPGTEAVAGGEEIDREIERELALGKNKRSIARVIGGRSGRPAREIYARAVTLARRETDGEGRKAKDS